MSDTAFELIDVTELRAGDMVLPWEEGAPFGPWTVVRVERVPFGGYGGGGTVSYRTEITFDTRTEHCATGVRKVVRRG